LTISGCGSGRLDMYQKREDSLEKKLYLFDYAGIESHAAKSLIKFQKILNIPAVQLVNKSGICKLVSNNNLKIMIISADHWLSLLP